jgi:hypothetical protein
MLVYQRVFMGYSWGYDEKMGYTNSLGVLLMWLVQNVVDFKINHVSEYPTGIKSCGIHQIISYHFGDGEKTP